MNVAKYEKYIYRSYLLLFLYSYIILVVVFVTENTNNVICNWIVMKKINTKAFESRCLESQAIYDVSKNKFGNECAPCVVSLDW